MAQWTDRTRDEGRVPLSARRSIRTRTGVLVEREVEKMEKSSSVGSRVDGDVCGSGGSGWVGMGVWGGGVGDGCLVEVGGGQRRAGGRRRSVAAAPPLCRRRRERERERERECRVHAGTSSFPPSPIPPPLPPPFTSTTPLFHHAGHVQLYRQSPGE
jgi:hypothetical protein